MDRRSRATASAGSISTSSSIPPFTCSTCWRTCTSHIGMFAHQRVCHPWGSSKATTQSMCMLAHDKTKMPDQNELKLGTVVVLDSLSKSVDVEFKRSRVMGTGYSRWTSGTLHKRRPGALPCQLTKLTVSISTEMILKRNKLNRLLYRCRPAAKHCNVIMVNMQKQAGKTSRCSLHFGF